MIKFTIDGRLPSLNEYTNVNRNNKYAGARMKKDTQVRIAMILHPIKRANKDTLPIDNPVVIHFAWYEANGKRDLDNVAFAKKFILDALVDRGILHGDGQKYVKGFTDTFYIDPKNPRIEVVVDAEKEEI